MDHTFRRNLIEALKSRGWTSPDAERVAATIASLYESSEGEWQVWPRQVADEPGHYRVARDENAISVFDSLLEGRARDVAGALNEINGHVSDATGTP